MNDVGIILYASAITEPYSNYYTKRQRWSTKLTVSPISVTTQYK